jgi:hypothetical protein
VCGFCGYGLDVSIVICASEAGLCLVPQIILQQALELSEAVKGKIRSHFE